MASGSIKTTETVLSIVEAVAHLDQPSLSEITDHVSLAKSTVHKHLSTLRDLEYVIKEDGTYDVSLQFLELGMQRKHSYRIASLAQTNLVQLADETGETVWIIVEEFGCAVNLDKCKGEYAVQTVTDIGNRVPMHQSAGGKCILSHMPDDKVDEIIETRGLEARTQHTITSRSALESELETIRERGYAINNMEVVPDVRAIGAPILFQGDPVAAISISGPAYRLSGDLLNEQIPNMLLATTNEIELRLEYETTGNL